MKSGWKGKPLGDLCDFRRGLTYAKSDEVNLSANVVLRATNIDLSSNLLNLTELKYISEKVAVPESKKVKKDSLIICTASGSKSHLGKVAFVDSDYGYAFGGFMGMITPRNELNPRYLFHLMTSPDYKEFIEQLSDGVNINNLKFDDLKNFQVPHPELTEQRRIVSILDEAFDRIATTKANSEKNLQNARELFQSVLSRAVIGKVTQAWREARSSDGPNAATDLKVLLQQVKAKQQKASRSEETTGHEIVNILPAEWRHTLIGSLFKLIDYRGKNPPMSNHGRRLITAKNIKMGFISEHPLTYISEEVYSRWMIRGFPKLGDILFVTEGHTMGFVALNTRKDDFALAQRTITLQPIVPFNTNYFFYFMMSSAFQTLVKLNATGAAAVGMKGSKFRGLPLPFPPFAEQETIARKLDDLLAETQRLESLYQRRLVALDELKKSLLHQAFSGQL